MSMGENPKGYDNPCFGDIPAPYNDYSQARWVVLPIAYDGTSTWGKGADRGPEALLEASANMELYHIETESEPYRQGVFTHALLQGYATPDAMVEAGEKTTLRLIQEGKKVLTLGGEHSVSIGPIKAHHACYEQLTVLQIDAHTDLRNEYMGSPYNHACVMARAQDLGATVHVGIRSMDTSERERASRAKVFYAHTLQHGEEWIDEVLACLTENVYITFDLDGLDPSILPATGTPEPGGLGWYPTLRLIERVIMERTLVGADIVELCPNAYSDPSNFAAAKIAYHILAYDGKRNSLA